MLGRAARAAKAVERRPARSIGRTWPAALGPCNPRPSAYRVRVSDPDPHNLRIDLRSATRDELPVVSRLGATAFAALGDYGGILRDWVREPGVQTTVAARPGGAVIGFVTWAFVRAPGAPAACCEMIAVFVEPALRGRGLGARLMQHALALGARHAATLGVSRAALHVAADNGPARALFESLGFERAPAEDTAYPSGAASLRMVRALAPVAAGDAAREADASAQESA